MVKTTDILPGNSCEKAGYLEFAGTQIYAVLHEVRDPVARVLLVGPFASERHFSYVPWVGWARFLASRQIEVLRFDYRGVGESTGVFEDLSFDDWNKDVEFLASWLRSRSPGVPLVLHGLEIGALLAGRNFRAGVGDALLLWSAPANANEVLRATLKRRIAVEQAFKDVGERKPASDYLQQLESGKPLDVDGYQWTAKLWRESCQFEIPVGKADEANSSDQRPTRSVRLDKRAAPLVKGSSLGYVVSLNPDLSALFTENFEWISTTLSSSPWRTQ